MAELRVRLSDGTLAAAIQNVSMDNALRLLGNVGFRPTQSVKPGIMTYRSTDDQHLTFPIGIDREQNKVQVRLYVWKDAVLALEA